MSDFKVGMKIYSYDWYWKYKLDYDEAASLLKKQGIGFVISQNEYVPSVSTSVAAEVPEEYIEAFKRYDDRLFRNALSKAGIEYWGSVQMFFNLKEMYKFGNVPVDNKGKAAEKADWYIGACPTCEEYVNNRILQMENAAKALKPDGFLLQFMRFPGFWETWLPGTNPDEWTEYCYCRRCLDLFQKAKGIAIPENDGVVPGERIRKNASGEFADWKGDILYDIISRIKGRINVIRPGTKIMLNTIPFDKKHFDDFGRKIFGQDLEKLKDVVDVYEVMAYHQILGLPPEWVADAGKEIKDRISGREVVCTVQAAPSYIGGMHAGKGRQTEISVEEFGAAIARVKNLKLDGAVVFAWADFLEQLIVHNDTAIIDKFKNLAD